MLTSTNYSTTPVITVSIIVENCKSKVSGGFIYLKPDIIQVSANLGFNVKPSKFSWKGFLSLKAAPLSRRC